MKINLWCYLAIFSLLLIGAFSLTSCVGSSTTASEYYNAGNANLSITGAQFDQYYLMRFDTSTSALTMALPSAVDIVANLQSPYVGEVIDVAVAADGVNSVTLIAGTRVNIKETDVQFDRFSGHDETIMPDRQIMLGNSVLLTQNVNLARKLKFLSILRQHTPEN
jgi:hypothetical protein